MQLRYFTMMLIWLQIITKSESNKIKLRDITYLANSLTSEDCFKLYNLLEHRTLIKGEVSTFAEMERAGTIPCISLLTAWLTDPLESEFRSYKFIESKLNEIERANLATWLRDDTPNNQQVPSNQASEEMESKKANHSMIGDSAISSKFWQTVIIAVAAILFVFILLCCCCYLQRKIFSCCTTEKCEEPRHRFNIDEEIYRSSACPNRRKSKDDFTWNNLKPTYWFGDVKSNEQTQTENPSEMKLLLTPSKQSCNFPYDLKTRCKTKRYQSYLTSKNEKGKYPVTNNSSVVEVQPVFKFKDSARNSFSTSPKPYEIDKEGNFNWMFELDDSSPIESDFLQSLNIERRSFVKDVDSTTSTVSEDITILTSQVLQSCKSEIEKCDKKLQKRANIRGCDESKNPFCCNNGESIDEQDPCEDDEYSTDQDADLNETYDKLGLLFSQFMKQQSQPCQRKYCCLTRCLQQKNNHDEKKCRFNVRKYYHGYLKEYRPSCSNGNVCKDTYDELELMRVSPKGRKRLGKSIYERRKQFLDQPCVTPSRQSLTA